MTEKHDPENRASGADSVASDAERALKNLRYVVGSVNDSALAVWAELWREFQRVAADERVAAETDRGFRPGCGWAEFLEKFWLLKHYLDYVHRFCQ